MSPSGRPQPPRDLLQPARRFLKTTARGAPRLYLALVLTLSFGCDPASQASPASTEPVAPAEDGVVQAGVADDGTAEAAAAGDPARGRQLLEHYECARCHEGAGLAPADVQHGCVSCHRAITARTFDAEPALLEEWAANLHSLPDAPHLDGARRFRAEWIADFLEEPTDLRPRLQATMPRLAIDARDARDLAAALVERAPEYASSQPGDAARGAQLVQARPCGICHQRGGQPLVGRGDPGLRGPALARAQRLAPDLRFAAERMSEASLVAWLRDPRAIHAQTDMPSPDLSESEARDVARWIGAAPLPEPAPREVPARAPPVEEEVSYDSLERELFRDVCWHCHSDPTYALGDGGPGNAGGFGFEGRGLDLSSYTGLRSGALGPDGTRHSVFEEVQLEGRRMPRIVAVLRARQLEEAGRPSDSIRGMPLGLPSVSPQLIARLEAWIAQGRAR